MSLVHRIATPATAAAIATSAGLLLAGCGGAATTDSQGAGATAGTVAGSAAASSSSEPVERGQMCGQTRGPDGPLYVHVLGSTPVDCTEAMKIANDFGPKIANAKPVTIDGWSCTFPTTPDLLTRCDSGDKAIGFYSSH